MDENCTSGGWTDGTAVFTPTQVGHVCSQCATGTYKSVVGNDACADCPVGLSSPIGSTTQDDCSCKPGFTSVDGLSWCSKVQLRPSTLVNPGLQLQSSCVVLPMGELRPTGQSAQASFPTTDL